MPTHSRAALRQQMTDRLSEVRTFQITVSLAVAAMVSLNAAPARAAPRPNVVFILVDDLGWTDAEYAGSDLYQTPHIDRLAWRKRVGAQLSRPNPAHDPTRVGEFQVAAPR